MNGEKNPFSEWAETMERMQKVLPSLEDLVNQKCEQKDKTLLKEIYTREEVRDLLCVTYPTLNEWHKKRILRNFRIGKRVYYDPREIKRYMSSKD